MRVNDVHDDQTGSNGNNGRCVLEPNHGLFNCVNSPFIYRLFPKLLVFDCNSNGYITKCSHVIVYKS